MESHVRFGLAVVSDGRTDYLRQCLASLTAQTGFLTESDPFDFSVIVDDSDMGAAHDTFDSLFDRSLVHGERLGLAASLRDAWRIAAETDVDYLFHVEEDFTFRRRVPLASMAFVLDAHRFLSELTLVRQPWSEEEVAAGGIVAKDPHDYVECVRHGLQWLEHRRLFSFNPSLLPRSTFDRVYPPGAVEREITDTLNADPDNRFGLWGGRHDVPWCDHIGAVRSAGWRL